jgi:hypothetical protein
LALPLLLLLPPPMPGMLLLRADMACCADWLKRFSWISICNSDTMTLRWTGKAS